MNLDKRETATVLAALRYWQREGLMSGGHEHDIASDNDTYDPLGEAEIDGLCERLNTEPDGYAKALSAIVALCHGEWDQPDLVRFGALSEDPMNDVEEIAELALAGEPFDEDERMTPLT